MTDRDITLLLADAADDVEIGLAPVQAVVRGGRRRRTRRWAVAAATAVLVAGSTVSLAMTGLQDGDGKRGAPVATQPPTAEERDVTKAQRTVLGHGYDNQSLGWEVVIYVWAAPRDEAEARAQLAAMTEHGETPDVRQASDLIGKSSYIVWKTSENSGSRVWVDTFRTNSVSDTNMQYITGSLGTGPGNSNRLVIGQVAKSVQRVTCTWKDGRTTEVSRVPARLDVDIEEEVIRPAQGSPVDWFVCSAPWEGEFKSVRVTK
ncbi:hypothetical protein [Streptomyces graminofaciens]|nr:hypothetical protein [Streptomyces graminofaciens]